jgi:hypothetical protein
MLPNLYSAKLQVSNAIGPASAPVHEDLLVRHCGKKALQCYGVPWISLAVDDSSKPWRAFNRSPLWQKDKSLKAANKFQITKTMRLATLLAFMSDIHALGLKTIQGLYLTTGWFWDLNDTTRAFSKLLRENQTPVNDDPGGILFGYSHLFQRSEGRNSTK